MVVKDGVCTAKLSTDNQGRLLSMPQTLDDIVSRFGADVRAKLNDPAAVGEPEDQLRAPLEMLISGINGLLGSKATGVNAVGEVRLPDLMTRPDYAVTRQGLIGFIESKAPGLNRSLCKIAGVPRHAVLLSEGDGWVEDGHSNFSAGTVVIHGLAISTLRIVCGISNG